MLRRMRWIALLAVLPAMLIGLLFPGGAIAGPTPQSQQIRRPVPPFWDVVGTDYQDEIGILWKLGIASGTSETTFSPSQKVTRGQAAAFIMRALGRGNEKASGSLPFTDVPASHYAANFIMLANQSGIIKGITENTFDPDGYVTHAQLITMLIRALNQESYVTGSWPVGYVLRAQEIGLLENISFSIPKEASRAETARFLVNALFKVKSPSTQQTLSQSLIRVPAALAVGPDSEYVAGADVALSATGIDWFGNPFPLDNAQFVVTSGNGRVSGSRLTITSGAVTVEARSNGLTAARTFSLAQGLTITPAAAFTRPDRPVTLSAAIKIDDRNSKPVTPTWSVLSGPARVSDSGVVTFTGAGSATVQATYGDFRQTATVTAGSDLAITPDMPMVGVGETVSFTAKAQGPNGLVDVPVTWSVVGGDGRITPGGLFTAGNFASTVQASANGMTATTKVSVINRLEISPREALLSKAESVTFTAKAFTSDGQEVQGVTPTFEWSNRGIAVAEGGTVVAYGSGRGVMTARYRGLTATANVSVASDPVGLVLSSDKVSIPANGVSTATITAKVVDTNGITVKGSRLITFQLGNSLARLDKTVATAEDGTATTTLTVGSSSGTITVLASTPGLASSQTQVTLLVPTAERVKLSAYPSVIGNTGSSTITATLVDSTGTEIANRTGSSFTVNLVQSGGTGTLQTTSLQIPPGVSKASVVFQGNGQIGRSTISGVAVANVDPVTIQSVVLGDAAKLAIRPIKATVADGVTAMTVDVEVQDGQGALRAADSSHTVSLQATTESGRSLTIYPLHATNGVASFRVTTDKADTYSFTASSSSLASAAATGVFTPGAAAKIELTADPDKDFAADTVSGTTLIARVVDARGNLVPNVNPAITFHMVAASNSISWTDDTEVPASNGVATLRVRSTAYPGTASFVAKANALAESVALQLTTRITGVADHLQVQPITSMQSGGSTTVKVFVRDSQNYLVTGDNGRLISLVTDSATATVSGPQPAVNGVATFTLTDTVAENVKVTASGTGVTADGNGYTVTVLPAAPQKIILVATPSALAASSLSTAQVSAYVVDQYGNKLPGNYHNVQLTLSSNAYGTLTQNNVSTVGGYSTFRASGASGSVTINGTAGLPVTPVTVSTYQPGTPTRVVLEVIPHPTAGLTAGSQITVKAKILDNNGNLASWLNSSSTVSHAGILIQGANTTTGTTTTTVTSGAYGSLINLGFTPDGITRGSAPFQNGEATFVIRNTKAQTVTLVPYVWYNNAALPAESAILTTVAGPATQLLASPSPLLLNSRTETTGQLQVTLADAFGNPTGNSGDTVSVALNTNSHISLPNGASYLLSTDGTVVIPVRSRADITGGTTQLTITASKAGKMVVASVVTDTPPDAPYVSFPNSSVSASSSWVRVYVDGVSRRNTAQQILLFVNGMQLTIYSEANATSQTVTQIAPNSLTATGYVRLSDLGAPGVKSLQAYLLTDLGISPAGPVFTLTVTP